MTKPDPLALLRNINIPESMAGSKALRDFLISQVEAADEHPDPRQQIQTFQRALTLLTMSHLEVVNALGVLEQKLKAVQQSRKQNRPS